MYVPGSPKNHLFHLYFIFNTFKIIHTQQRCKTCPRGVSLMRWGCYHTERLQTGSVLLCILGVFCVCFSMWLMTGRMLITTGFHLACVWLTIASLHRVKGPPTQVDPPTHGIMCLSWATLFLLGRRWHFMLRQGCRENTEVSWGRGSAWLSTRGGRLTSQRGRLRAANTMNWWLFHSDRATCLGNSPRSLWF